MTALEALEDRQDDIDHQRILEVLREPYGHRGGRIIDKIEGERRQQRKQQIHARSSSRHPDHVAARIAQCAKVDRDRFCVAEQERRAHQQEERRQQDRSERVDVFEWIEADPAELPGGIVAQEVCDEAMRGLVKRDGDHERYDPGGHYIGPVLTSSNRLSTRHQRFACARLSQSYLPKSRSDFSATFTTIAFDDSSLRWLEINT